MKKRIAHLFVLIIFLSIISSIVKENEPLILKNFTKEKNSVLILYDSKDPMIEKLTLDYANIVKSNYLNAHIYPVNSLKDFYSQLLTSSWVLIYFFHGINDGLLINDLFIEWKQLATYINKSPVKNHILLSCYSSNIKEYIDNSRNIFLVEEEQDSKILMIDGLFKLASLMTDTYEATAIEAAEGIITETLNFIEFNIADLALRSIIPLEPLGATISIPENSGFGGPVGYIVDSFMKAFQGQTLTVGGTYDAEFIDSDYGSSQDDITAAFGFEWDFSLTVKKEDELEGHIGITFSTQQSGFTGTILESLAGVEWTIEGEGDFVLKLISEPEVRIEIKDWHFRIRITISRTIGLYDLIEKIWPSAKNTIDKLPKKIRGKVKSALNRVKITPYLGGEFEIFSNSDGDDEYIIAVFFGVSMNVDVPVVDIGGGAEFEIAYHFTSSGNYLLFTLDFGFEIDVPWPFSDKERSWVREWQKGPGSSEGKQMNHDLDGDGLTDSYENQIGTDPSKMDSDSDGLPDGVELAVYFTDPRIFDTDSDGLGDGEEVTYFEGRFLDPLGDYDSDGLSHIKDNDSDNDGLIDGDEVNGLNQFNFTSDPLKKDTDGDGLQDNEEVKGLNSILVNNIQIIVFSNPNERDSDNDLVNDLEEVRMNSNPLLTDSDADGITDYDELLKYSIKWNHSDTDGDGLTDSEEIIGINVPGIGIVTSDPNLVDTDGDGLSDHEEMKTGKLITWQTVPTTVYSNPRLLDTDGDGISDYEESLDTNPYQTFPTDADSDNDGLNDNEFRLYGTFPTKSDSDQDGLNDSIEVNYWLSNPLVNDTDADGLLDGEEVLIFQAIDPQFNVSSNYDPDSYTGILDFDSDNGGIGDGDEYVFGSKLNDSFDDGNVDTDGDGMPDLWEDDYSLDKEVAADNVTDADNDGLLNVYEYRNGTNPQMNDTDGDGLLDGEEVGIWSSNPLKIDSDEDGLDDSEEISYFTSIITGFNSASDFDSDGITGIMDYDSDNDLLSDGLESSQEYFGFQKTNATKSDTDGDTILDGIEVINYRTDPTLSDTDGEGLLDNQEIQGMLIIWQTSSGPLPVMVYSDPKIPDTDFDGLTDFEEVINWDSFPSDPDSDNDSITDGAEVAYFMQYGPFDKTTNFDPTYDNIKGIQDNDSDNDGLNDGQELALGTSPILWDTDFDGPTDYYEVYGYGFNLINPFTGLPELLLYHTNPLDNDTDDDGLSDGIEVFGIPYQNGTVYTDPTRIDTDGDGLIDGIEINGINMTVMNQNITVFTNPMHPDTDNDMISDFEEIFSWNWFSHRSYDVRAPNVLGIIGMGEDPPFRVEMSTQTQFASIAALRGGFITDPTDPDTDDDGLTEGEEKYGVVNYTVVRTPTQTYEAIPLPIITNPIKNDTDGDGIIDGEEINTTNPFNTTNPNLRDTDEDGISDFDEINVYKTNPRSYDTDNDFLNDRYELFVSHQNSTLPFNKTDPLNPDTDSDDLPDGLEISLWHTHPLNNDSDFDNLSDGDEVTLYFTDPFLNDTDNDGLTDYDEIELYLTLPLDPDTDKDGIYDGIEVLFYLTNPKQLDENNDSKPDGWDYDFDDDFLSDYEETIVYGTLFYENDTDEDGLADGIERDYFEFWNADANGDPDKDGFNNLLDIDSDNDNLTDYEEWVHGTNPASLDSDNDTLSDYDEINIYLTDPLKADTDNDGITDSEELILGTDPLDSDSDNDGWLDGNDPDPLNPYVPNLFIGIIGVPGIIALALVIIFRQKVLYSIQILSKRLRKT